MNLIAEIAMPDPSTIKRIVLVLFVVVTLGIKVSDVVEARRTRSN